MENISSHLSKRKNSKAHPLYYEDENGYLRWRSNNRLIHRDTAYKKIYLAERWKYPLPFSAYVVHHKDGNKKNNYPENLQILLQSEHEKIHNITPQSKCGMLLFVIVYCLFFSTFWTSRSKEILVLMFNIQHL